MPESEQLEPPAKRKPLVRLSEAEWVAARHDYESGALPSYPAIGAKYGISEETVQKRSQRDGGWQRNALGVAGKSSIAILQQATDKALTETAAKLAERLTSSYERDLAPFIEKEKRLHIRDSIRRAKARQKLLDAIVDESEQITPKDAACIARADDTYDQIKRRNLGMDSEKAGSGSLTLSFLTNQAAVQVVQNQANP